MALTDKMSLDNSTLDFHLRMPIYIPSFGRRGLGNCLIIVRFFKADYLAFTKLLLTLLNN